MKFHLKCAQAHQEGKNLSTEQQKKGSAVSQKLIYNETKK